MGGEPATLRRAGRHGRPGGHLHQPAEPQPARRRAARPGPRARRHPRRDGQVAEGVKTVHAAVRAGRPARAVDAHHPHDPSRRDRRDHRRRRLRRAARRPTRPATSPNPAEPGRRAPAAGPTRHETAWRGPARPGRAWHGATWHSPARPGTARHGTAWPTSPGLARDGLAHHGPARPTRPQARRARRGRAARPGHDGSGWCRQTRHHQRRPGTARPRTPTNPTRHRTCRQAVPRPARSPSQQPSNRTPGQRGLEPKRGREKHDATARPERDPGNLADGREHRAHCAHADGRGIRGAAHPGAAGAEGCRSGASRDRGGPRRRRVAPPASGSRAVSTPKRRITTVGWT